MTIAVCSKTRGKDNKKLTESRPIKLKEFDSGLAERIKERRGQKQKITYNLIIHEAALRLIKIPSGTTLLKVRSIRRSSLAMYAMLLALGSCHVWRHRFMRRHKFTLRKPTPVAQKAPVDYAEKIVKFIVYTEQLRKKEKFKHAFGADEPVP